MTHITGWGDLMPDCCPRHVAKAAKEEQHMGKLIWKGWSTRAEDIPQQTSILLGANIRKPLDLQNLDKDPAEAALEQSDWTTKLNRRKKALRRKGGAI